MSLGCQFIECGGMRVNVDGQSGLVSEVHIILIACHQIDACVRAVWHVRAIQGMLRDAD